ITSVVKGAVSVIGNTIDLVLKIIDGDWSGAWEAAKNILKSAIEAIGGILGGLWRIVSGAIRFVGTGLLGVAGDFLQAAYNLGAALVNGIIRAIKAAPGAIVAAVKYLFSNALGDLAGWLYAKGAAIWRYLKDGFTGASRQPIDFKPKVNLSPE